MPSEGRLARGSLSGAFALGVLATSCLACSSPEFDVRREGGIRLVYELTCSPAGGPSSPSLPGRTAKVIETRLGEIGVKKRKVTPAAGGVVVDLPRPDEPAELDRIKRVISQTASLAFRIVDDEGSKAFVLGLAKRLEEAGPIEVRRELGVPAGGTKTVDSWYLVAEDQPDGRSGRRVLEDLLAGIEVPANHVIGFQADDSAARRRTAPSNTWRSFYLREPPGVTGDHVADARVGTDEATGQPYVILVFTARGAQALAGITGANVQRRMAIQIDDTVNSAPIIWERIPGGEARITLGGDRSNGELLAEARDLAAVLRAGALPCAVRGVSEEWIDPARR